MTFCSNCVKQLDSDARFCPSCGEVISAATTEVPQDQVPVAQYPAPPTSPPPTQQLLADAALIVDLPWEPVEQDRINVLFRIIFALPLLVVAWAFLIAGYFATIASWFAALFTGQVPDQLQNFGLQVLRVTANAAAYFTLVLPESPGIFPDVASNDKQVKLSLAHSKMNPVAVLFRIVLIVPSAILVSCLLSGATFLVIGAWFIALFTGSVPRALHQAIAITVRCQLRFLAYLFLLTPEQPWHGIFGDGVEADEEEAKAWTLIKPAKILLIAALVVGAISVGIRSSQSDHSQDQMADGSGGTTISKSSCAYVLANWVVITVGNDYAGQSDDAYFFTFGQNSSITSWIQSEMGEYVGNAAQDGVNSAQQALLRSAVMQCVQLQQDGESINDLPSHP